MIDHFAENSRHYLVMEFVAGGDLQGVLDKLGPKGKLPEDAGAAMGAPDARRAGFFCTARRRRSFIATSSPAIS